MAEEENKVGNTRIFKLIAKTKPTLLCAANPKRLNVYFYNKGSSAVEVLSSKDQAYGDGIPVASSGEFSDEVSTARLYVIAESANQELRVKVDSE